MADTNRKTEEEKREDVEAEQSDTKQEKTDKKAMGGIFLWTILFTVVSLCGGAGFALGQFFAASRRPGPTEHSQENQPAPPEYLKTDAPTKDFQKVWYYDLQPVIANLNEPGVTRYVRASITLEINSEVDQNKGRAFLDEKKPLLTNWIAIYLASLSLEDIRGNRNLKRIQSQILDSFNEQLFPDSKPYIQHILFKEFAVQ